MNNKLAFRSQQRGAALVIGMLLLLVLTVLAISGMGTSALEFIMAGNEQFKQDAFQTAEAGIADAYSGVATGATTLNPDPKLAPPVKSDVLMPGSTTDTYSWVINVQNGGNAITISNGNDAGAPVYVYEIQSDGSSSARGSKATHFQGMAIPAPAQPTVGCDATAASCAL